MTATPIVVSPDTPIDEVARLLVARHVHRVLVADSAGLHGVISALDVLRLVADGRLREV
jgi:CBS domain-containing protein